MDLTPFQTLSSVRNLVQHDECERLFVAVNQMRSTGANEWAWTDDLVKNDGTLLTQCEVWDQAIEAVLGVIDGRMSWLRES